MPSLCPYTLPALPGPSLTCRCELVSWLQCCSGWCRCLQFLGKIGTYQGLSGIHNWSLRKVSSWWLSASPSVDLWSDGEIARLRWARCPMLVLISFAVKALFLIILLVASNHATSLFWGRQNRSQWKSISHPRNTFYSSRRASDFSLFLPPSSPEVLACFHTADVSTCQKLGGEWDCIKQGCRSLLHPLPEKWGRQCNHRLCLVGWCQFQQSAQGHLWMGMSHPRFLEGGQDVDFFQTTPMGPTSSCI